MSGKLSIKNTKEGTSCRIRVPLLYD